MSTTLPPTAENPDQFGRFTIVTREMNDEGVNTSVYRAPVAPGAWVDGAWVPTPIDSLPESVQAFATGLWTEAAIDRFKAAFPWTPPPPPPAAVVRVETLWRRASDEEAVTIDAAVSGLSVRLQKMFAAASSLTAGDEVTEALRTALSVSLSTDRVNELLASD